MPTFMSDLALLNLVPGMMHSMSMSPYWMSACIGNNIHQLYLGKLFPRKLMIPKMACSTFLLFGGGISINALTFCGSGWTPFLDITCPKNSMDVHLKWHFSY